MIRNLLAEPLSRRTAAVGLMSDGTLVRAMRARGHRPDEAPVSPLGAPASPGMKEPFS
jgi:hypothetical protein